MPPDFTSVVEDGRSRADLNAWLATRTAAERIDWAVHALPGEHVLSSSFGAQSAAILHLVTRQCREIPVVLIDTGYLFPETYRFADRLKDKFSLNLKVFAAHHSAAWMEARFGKLWEKGVEGIQRYNTMRKVEPMKRALSELGAATWMAGLRRGQSQSRRAIDFLSIREGCWKLHPIADWTDRDVWNYLQKHNLPLHPLWDKGYISIGDVHTTQPWQPGMRPDATRFFGLKRECGLHFDA